MNHKQNQLSREGYCILPFPPELKGYLMSYIYKYCSESGIINDDRDIEDSILSIPDGEFSNAFTKQFRFFRNKQATRVLEWAKKEIEPILDSHISINKIRPLEKSDKLGVAADNLDVYWRCVRNNKKDVGEPHSDFQFWELDKRNKNLPVGYEGVNERWKLWIQLSGCTAGNSLQFIPGSHHENIPGSFVETNHGLRPKIDQEWLEKNNIRFKKIEANNEVSCILFHDKLVHKGVINTESKIRFSAELTLLATRKN